MKLTFLKTISYWFYFQSDLDIIWRQMILDECVLRICWSKVSEKLCAAVNWKLANCVFCSVTCCWTLSKSFLPVMISFSCVSLKLSFAYHKNHAHRKSTEELNAMSSYELFIWGTVEPPGKYIITKKNRVQEGTWGLKIVSVSNGEGGNGGHLTAQCYLSHHF